MSRSKVFSATAALLAAGVVATAQTAVTNIFQNVNKVIPDGQLTGVSDTRQLTFAGPGMAAVTDVEVFLTTDVDPDLALDTDSRTDLLGSFDGTDPNRAGTLFLADLDFGQQGTLAQWGVLVTAVPEPSIWAFVGLGGAILGMHFLQRRVSK
jgi:hypothetical protein